MVWVWHVGVNVCHSLVIPQVDRTTNLLAKPSVLPGVVILEKPFEMTCTLKNLRYTRAYILRIPQGEGQPLCNS